MTKFNSLDEVDQALQIVAGINFEQASNLSDIELNKINQRLTSAEAASKNPHSAECEKRDAWTEGYLEAASVTSEAARELITLVVEAAKKAAFEAGFEAACTVGFIVAQEMVAKAEGPAFENGYNAAVEELVESEPENSDVWFDGYNAAVDDIAECGKDDGAFDEVGIAYVESFEIDTSDFEQSEDYTGEEIGIDNRDAGGSHTQVTEEQLMEALTSTFGRPIA